MRGKTRSLTLMKDIKAYTYDANKVIALAELNEMTTAEVIELFMEFIDDVCKEYHLKQYEEV